MTRRQGLGAMLVVGTMLSLVPAPAPAHDHKPPRVILRSPGGRQVGRPWSYEWSARQSEDICSGEAVDGIPNYRRRALSWRPRRRIHVRLFKRQRPRRVAIRMWVRLDDSGEPVGRGRRADVTLRRAQINGRRIWIVGFHGRRDARRHLYLGVHLRYRDVEGCGGAQTMELAFHLRRRVV